jgi:hypothetical protein
MLGQVSVFDKEKHVIIKGDLSDWCEKLVKNTNESNRELFVVHYVKIGSFVIAEWAAPNHLVFTDVINLGNSLANFTKEKADELRKRLFAPVTTYESLEYSTQAESDYHHQMQDDCEAEKERLREVY